MLHKNITPADMHPMHAWAVADAAALTALTPVAADKGKIAWQLDTNDFYILTDHTGPTWELLNSGAPAGYPATAISITDAGAYFTGAQVEAALQEVGASLGSLDGRLDTLEAKVLPYDIYLALGDETTAITASTSVAKVTFRVRRAFNLTNVYADLNVAQASGSIVTFDVKKNGTSIFSTLLTIDNTELDSATAATAAVLTSNPTAFAVNDVVTIFITQCDAATAAKGPKLTLKGGIAI